MSIDSVVEDDTLILNVESVMLRQNISRELHKLYGFDIFQITFSLDPNTSQVRIKKLKCPSTVLLGRLDEKYQT
jgi:hypothetical protein